MLEKGDVGNKIEALVISSHVGCTRVMLKDPSSGFGDTIARLTGARDFEANLSIPFVLFTVNALMANASSRRAKADLAWAHWPCLLEHSFFVCNQCNICHSLYSKRIKKDTIAPGFFLN